MSQCFFTFLLFVLPHRVTDSPTATRGALLISRRRRCRARGWRANQPARFSCPSKSMDRRPCVFHACGGRRSASSSCITRRNYPIIGHDLALPARSSTAQAVRGPADALSFVSTRYRGIQISRILFYGANITWRELYRPIALMYTTREVRHRSTCSFRNWKSELLWVITTASRTCSGFIFLFSSECHARKILAYRLLDPRTTVDGNDCNKKKSSSMYQI